MAKRTKYLDLIEDIVSMKQEGKGSRFIGKVLGCSKSFVNDAYNRYMSETSKVEDSKVEDEELSDQQLDVLCDSPDWSVSNLAKRLRSAQRSNNQLRKIHRETVDPTYHLENVLTGIEKAVEKINTPPPRNFDIFKSDGDKCTVEILLSDLQIGKVGQYYNTHLAEKALKRYGESLIHNITTRATKYDYDKIVLAMLGDTVEDHLKHGVQSATSTDTGLSEQIANATSMIWAYVIKPLAQLDIPMEVVCIAGNHGSSQHKGMDMYKAGLFSYDYPIYRAHEALCKEVGFDHVSFIIPEGVFGYTEIYGRTAVYEHGYFNSATEKSMEDQMKKRGQQLKRHVEYFRCGDMHHLCSYDCHKMVLNGAFFGTDFDGIEYSGILGFNSTPAQAMMFHTPERSLGRNTIKEFVSIQVADGY